MSISAPKSQFPPLAISDLLVLTLTVGVALAVIAPDIHDFLALPIEELRIPRWRGVVPEITDYTAIGISLFGLIVLARERIRGSAFHLAPGHWIFLATGPYLFLLLVSGAANQLLMVNWFDIHPGHRRLLSALFATVLALSVGFALPGLRGKEPRWRVCLVLVLIWLFIGAVESVHETNSGGRLSRHLLAGGATVYLVAFGSACAAVAIDILRGIHRDWLHYFAIVLLALYAASNVLHYGALISGWWRDLLFHLLP